MTNTKIADTFEQIAELLEFQGANPFRIRAYRNGARTIRDLPEPIANIATDPDRQLTDIDGISKDLAEKCQLLVLTGHLPQLTELLEVIPSSVLDLLRIPSLGPKKAKVLYDQLGISTLDGLQSACEQGRVRELKGFGAKTETLILKGIPLAAQAGARMLWARADETAKEILDHLGACSSIEQIQMAGSYRRGRETVGDLDVLVVSANVDQVMDRFGVLPYVEQVIARGETKMSIRLASGLSVDLRVVAAESFGAALQYFTGSADHNVVLRGMARQHGLKINEYGVFRTTGENDEYVAGATEEDVYGALGLPVFPPEMREARREFDWARDEDLPQLVNESDILGDLHMHTTESDGKASLMEMVQAAIDRGRHYVAITDHSQRVTMARGLDPERLLRQWVQIDELRDQLDGQITVLKGIECDILERGGMDLPDDVLAQADWVVGSVHYGQNQPRKKITERIIGALEHPYVSAIAHPTGRLINQREAYEVDMETVFAAAREHGKLLELNASPLRLDLNDVHCAAAKSYGVPVVISTDAHSVAGMDSMRYGVLQARRGGLTTRDVANTRSWHELRKMLARRA